MNLQPSEAEVGFDVRLPPTESLDVLRERIEEEWAPVSRNMTFQVSYQDVVIANLVAMASLHVLFSKPTSLFNNMTIK